MVFRVLDQEYLGVSGYIIIFLLFKNMYYKLSPEISIIQYQDKTIF